MVDALTAADAVATLAKVAAADTGFWFDVDAALLEPDEPACAPPVAAFWFEGFAESFWLDVDVPSFEDDPVADVSFVVDWKWGGINRLFKVGWMPNSF